MPQVGNVWVPDELMASSGAASRSRPSMSDIVSASAEGTWKQIKAAIPYQVDVLTRNQIDPGTEQQYQRGLAEANAAYARAPAARVEDVTSGRVGVGRFIAENLAQTLPQMAGVIAGGAAGGLVAGPGGALAGAVAAGTPIFSASNVGRAVEENGSLSVNAATRSLALAPAQAASDALIGRFLPGAGKLLGGAAATQSGNFLRRTATSIAKAGATEAVTEAGQQMGERAAAGIPLGSADAVGEYVNAAVTAFAVGGTLGAAGGFRRTNAVAAPVETVLENPDMLLAHIDGIISGSGRVSAASVQAAAEEQLGLGLEGGSAVEQQLGLPIAEVPAEAEARPSELPQLALDPALSDVPPDTQLELGQRFRDNVTPVELPLPGGTAVSPETEALIRAAVPAAVDTNLSNSTTLARGLQGTHLEPPAPGSALSSVQLPETFRPLQNVTVEELEGLRKTKGVTTEAVAEVDRELTERARETQGAAPLTTENFQTRVDELKRGLRGGFVANVEATTPTELADKVYDQIFVEADSRSNTVKFAQRLGILDADLKPGPLAAEVEARRAAAPEGTAATETDAGGFVQSPAPPAAPTAAPVQSSTVSAPAEIAPAPVVAPAAPDPVEVAAVAEAKKTAGIQRQSAELKSAQTLGDVFDLLANDRTKAKRAGEATPTEVLAKSLGLITNDDAMDYTPKGRTVFLQSSQGLEATTSAAADNGFLGAAASQFDRGARAAIGGQAQTTFADFEEMAAYNAGKVWATDFVANGEVSSAQQTQATVARQDDAKKGLRTALGAKQINPRARSGGVERAQLTPAQVQQQGFNQLLDGVNLNGVSDSDKTALRLMARNPKTTPAEMGAAIERVQRGTSLFTQPSTSAVALSTPVRGQPKFVEMNTPDAGPSRTEMRAETERAQIAQSLDELISFAEAEEAITPGRAAAMRRMLAKGRIEQVAKLLKDFDPDAVPAVPDKRRVEKITEPVAVQQAVVHDQLTGREKKALADHYGEKTYNKAAKSRFMADVGTAISEGLDKVAEVVRAVIRRVGEGVLAISMVFNPAALTTPDLQAMSVVQASTQVRIPAIAAAQMSATAKQVYQRMAGLAKQNGAGFMIVDKAGSKIHMFAADGSHIASDTVLTGATKEDFLTAERMATTSVPEIKQRATPAGMFTTQMFRQGNAVGNPIGFMLNDASGKSNFVAIHTTTIEQRQQVLDSQTLDDNAVTMGCVSLNPKLYAEKILPKAAQFDKNLVFVIPYDVTQLEAMLPPEQLALTPGKAPIKAPKTDGLDAFINDRDMIPTEDAADMLSPMRTVADTTEALKTFGERVSEGVKNLTIDDFKDAATGLYRRTTRSRALLYAASHAQLNRMFGGIMPGLLKHSAAHDWRDAVRGNFMAMNDDVNQNYEKLERENKKAAEWVSQLMATTTEFQVDPDKTWEEHTHIPDKDRARLEPMYDAAVKLKNDLSRSDSKGGMQVFNQLRALNETQNYARLSTTMHKFVAMDPELSQGVNGGTDNLAEAFLQTQGLNTPELVRDWWKKALEGQVAAATDFLKVKNGELTTAATTDQIAMKQHLAPVQMQLSLIAEAVNSMKKSPYFHLGRFGDYFGSAKVRTNADGTVNREAMTKFVAALEKAGFDDVQLSEVNSRPKVMLRFDTKAQTDRFKALMRELHAQNLLEGDLGDAVSSGARSRENNFGQVDGYSAFVQNYIEAIEASPIYVAPEGATAAERAVLKEQKDEAVRLALDTWLEAQPDTSISKVMTKRFTVPGYKKDMVRNFNHRARVGAISIANIAAAPKFAEANVEMRASVEAAKAGDSNADQYLLNDLYTEMRKRDATDPLYEAVDFFDKGRAITHSYFLGLSPAYVMINMTQMGVVGLPELAKKHGYSKSFAAMRRAGGDATKILKAAFDEAVALGPQNWANVALTENVLVRAGLSKDTIAFALRMLASATIDIGSQARSQGQVSENRVGSKLDRTLQYASAFGSYSETFSRLTMALAANELHTGDLDSSAAYATEVVNESMFKYQSSNTARMLGKKGILGPVTPMVAQFMSYSAQMTEKLCMEFSSAMGRPRLGDTPEQAAQRTKEARTFVLGHLTAIVALTGTLGLPFLTVFAAVLERLVDAFDDDDEPFDITASYRGWLSDVLGKDVAEVASRGIPRALGFDVSSRAGEQNLMPFSEFIADRRPWKEAIEGNVGRSLGALPSMVSNMVTGMGKIADGDVVGGMKDALPVAFKGPIEVYRMTDAGYIDGQGNKLPMSPNASAMVWQLMGFTPSEKAEYGEARGDQAARRGEIARRAGKLRDALVGQMGQNGDREKLKELVVEAQEFDKDNPGFRVLPSIMGSFTRRSQNAARAVATKSPLGVSMQDVAGQAQTRYANVGYAN